MNIEAQRRTDGEETPTGLLGLAPEFTTRADNGKRENKITGDRASNKPDFRKSPRPFYSLISRKGIFFATEGVIRSQYQSPARYR